MGRQSGLVRARCHVVTDTVRRCLLQFVAACFLVSSLKTMLVQFSSVTSLCARFQTHRVLKI